MGLFGKSRKEQEDKGQEDDTPFALGWHAITARFEQLYPAQTTPRHYGTVSRYRFGGSDPLDNNLTDYEREEVV